MERLFSNRIADGIFLISGTKKPEAPMEERMKPQRATSNSYLVIGEKKALLFDLAVNNRELWKYACSLTDKPVQLVLSHGHVDHICHLNQRKEVWLHPADMDMVKNGIRGVNGPTVPCPVMHPLNDGDVIDLGNRRLSVFHIPGHTPGSILLLDHQTKLLLSGDSIARRLLFGVGGRADIKIFREKTESMKAVDFQYAYSAHDRCPLPKRHLDRMLHSLKAIRREGKRMRLPFLGNVVTYKYGKESQLDYCDIAVFYPKKGRSRQVYEK